MPATELTIPARDGFSLAATLFEPAEAPRSVVIVNGATAVPRRYYAAFGAWLADRGHAVLTYDYRGIGGSRPASLRGFSCDMRQWATEDMGGALEWAAKRWPGARIAAVGHSSGGWLLGFLPGVDRLALAVTVASQSGYWGHWPRPLRYRRWLDWHVLLPATARAMGYVPGRMGLGEDLPKGVALQWSRWCREPSFTRDDPEADYAGVCVPIVAYSFPDDPYAPPAAVDALLETFTSAPIERRVVTPEQAGGPVGHFGFFRPNRQGLWPELERRIAARS